MRRTPPLRFAARPRSKRTDTPAQVMRRLRDDARLERLVQTDGLANVCAVLARAEGGCVKPRRLA
jgi:hypothetical protein